MINFKWPAHGLSASPLKVILLIGWALLGCGSSATSGSTGLCLSLQAQTIQPITTVDVANHIGYFSDPYLVPFAGSSSTYISGTTQKYMFCDGDLSPECAQETQNSVDFSAMQTQAEQAGAQICSIAGLHPFQDSTGLWMMAVTFHVNTEGSCGTGSATAGWSVIAHATPADGSTPPANWTADTLLVGSFTTVADANYDGKYFEDNGQLYLLYSKNLSTSPKRDGIVAQAMTSPTTPALSDPVLMLQPNLDSGNPLNSELYYDPGDGGTNSDFKLVETGNIKKINGKYVMAYSTGAYNRDTYKTAVAYCDTFLPAAGKTYRKVTMPDPNGYWGNTNDEVVYLLQSQKENWTGFFGPQVKAPGVPTIAGVGPNNSWALVFAGYAPDDTGLSGNTYDGSKRRPFYVQLNVSIPSDKSVSQVSEAELATWITLSTN